MQQIELFNESKEQLIKTFEIDRNTKIAYIISTFLNIMIRWPKTRVYIYDTANSNKIEGGINE